MPGKEAEGGTPIEEEREIEETGDDRQALARDTGYDRREEAEAEIIADLLLQRAHSWSPERTWHVPVDAADVVARIERSLG